MKNDDVSQQQLVDEPQPKPVYLAQLEHVTSQFVIRDRGEVPVVLSGEILVEGPPPGSDFSPGSFRRISLWSDTREELNSTITLAGPVEPMAEGSKPASAEQPFDMWLYHSRLLLEPPVYKESDATYPPLERMKGLLKWTLVDAYESGGRVILDIELNQTGGSGVEFIEKVTLPSVTATFQRVEAPSRPEQTKANSIVACGASAPAGTGHDSRALFVRFIRLSRAGAPIVNLEPLAQQLIDNACVVWWQKGGIRLVPFIPPGQAHATVETIHVAAQDFVCPGDPQSVCVALAQEPNVGTLSPSVSAVEVYLVDRLLDEPGGGITHGCRTPDSFIILEIRKAENNRYLLAHEVGHVLGLMHPDGGGCPGAAAGATCSVMVPDVPNSVRNPGANFTAVDTLAVPLGNVFVSLQTSCGRQADAAQSFSHIIRDFPYDDGALPSAAAAPFLDWWSSSDVWNSDKTPSFDHLNYTDGTPMFAANHAPLHVEPRASSTNRLCVRVRTCEPLTAIPPKIDVRFFLAVPGAANERLRPLEKNKVVVPALSFLGADLPSLGSPRTRSVEWTVPLGLPAHSCVFAVAQSQNQPTPPGLQAILDDPINTAFNFFSLFSFIASNNDVVQRNLHIQLVASSGGMPLWSTLGWLSMSNPLDQTGTASLSVDARSAAALLDLEVEIDDGIRQRLVPGEQQQIDLRPNMRHGDNMVFRVRARVPAGAQVDRTFPIVLHLMLGGRRISGYTQLLKVAPLPAVAAQVLDVLYAAVRDVAAVNGAASTVALAANIQAMASDPRNWETRLPSLAQDFSGASDQLAAVDVVGECRTARQGLLDLAGFLRQPLGDTTLALEQIRDLADRVQESAGRVVRRNWEPGN